MTWFLLQTYHEYTYTIHISTTIINHTDKPKCMLSPQYQNISICLFYPYSYYCYYYRLTWYDTINIDGHVFHHASFASAETHFFLVCSGSLKIIFELAHPRVTPTNAITLIPSCHAITYSSEMAIMHVCFCCTSFGCACCEDDFLDVDTSNSILAT